jgi:hypothetical protein
MRKWSKFGIEKSTFGGEGFLFMIPGRGPPVRVWRATGKKTRGRHACGCAEIIAQEVVEMYSDSGWENLSKNSQLSLACGGAEVNMWVSR